MAPIRSVLPTLQGLQQRSFLSWLEAKQKSAVKRGFRKASQAQEASRVEPRILRPMHYTSSAWDFLLTTDDLQSATSVLCKRTA